VGGGHTGVAAVGSVDGGAVTQQLSI